jgi:hypothetical protein
MRSLAPVLFLTSLACSGEPTEEPSSHEAIVAPVAVETAPSRTVLLGSINLKLAGNWTDEEVSQFKDLATKAHVKLTSSLGANVMTHESPITVPVYKSEIDGFRGAVSLQTAQYAFNDDFSVKLDNSVPLRGEVHMTIGELSEANIAHEFIHLFAQHVFMMSEGFWEGIAYGLTHNLYPEYYPNIDEFYMDDVQHPCVNQLFTDGWDFSVFDSNMNGGIQDYRTLKMVYSNWTLIWSDFIKSHPKFLEAFFTRLKEERSRGPLVFNRSDLHQLAIEVEPEFADWIAGAGASLNGMADRSPTQFTARIDHDTMAVVNLQTYSEVISDGHVTPGYSRPDSLTKPSIHDANGAEIATLPVNGFLLVNSPLIASQTLDFRRDGNSIPECVKP